MTPQPSVSGLALVLACACLVSFTLGEEGPLSLSFSKMAVFQEETCTRVGGWCMERDLCPDMKTAGVGLCPEQQRRDVECCFGIPKAVKSCAGAGGFCSAKPCDKKIQLPAEDCGSSSVCCALVS